MKICLISQNATPGLIIFRKDLIKYLVSKGFCVYAFAIDYDSSTVAKIKSFGAVPVAYSLNKSGFNPFVDIIDIFRLYSLLRDIKPDVVLSSFVKPSLYGTMAAAFAGIPRRLAMLEGLGYIHTRGNQGFGLKKRCLQLVHGALCTISYSLADKIIFLNRDDPVDLLRISIIDKCKVVVLGPIGLNLESFSYRPVEISKPIRFIFIARLLVEKGIVEYLEAARTVKRAFPQAEFVVLGGLDPDNPSALSQQQLDKFIAEDIIIYPGHVSNVSQWIAGAHVFVLPSYREGFPLSTQEAMSIGRAVITTDVPGCRETVIDGVNGFLVPPWNAVALAEKMTYLIERPEELKRMGEESHRIAAEQYDVHKINPVLASVITGETQ